MAPPTHTSAAAAGRHHAAGTPPLPRLLLVEDDRDAALLMAEVLTDHFGAGCVTSAGNLADARAADLAAIDLVLTDMNLPDGSGLELIEHLLARRSDLPVVVVTGESVLQVAFACIRAGAYDYVVKAGDYLFSLPVVVEKNLAIWHTKQENARLHRELARTVDEVKDKNRQLQDAIRKLESMASTDPLTGLANRRAFNGALERGFAEAVRYGHDLGCIMIDLDGFKQFNDALGHQTGDALLQAAGQVLASHSRRSDVPARYGGDEFVLLLPSTDIETARVVARRIADEFTQAARDFLEHLAPPAPAPGMVGDPATGAAGATDEDAAGRAGRLRPLSMSMGLATLRHSRSMSPQQLIAHADEALYRAKRSGKTCLMLYSPGFQEGAKRVI